LLLLKQVHVDAAIHNVIVAQNQTSASSIYSLLKQSIIGHCIKEDAYDPCKSFLGGRGAIFHRYDNKNRCKKRCVIRPSQELKGRGWKCGACADKALPGLYVRRPSSELEIVNCSPNSVEIMGELVNNLTSSNLVNNLFIYQNEDNITCSPCNQFYRFIKGAKKTITGTIIFSTRNAKVGEVLGDHVVQDIRSKDIEAVLPCTEEIQNLIASASTKLSDPSVSTSSGVGSVIQSQHQSSRIGSCNDEWLTIDKETGKCDHTDCVVSDPLDCFECSRKECDNGCGAKDHWLNTDGNFGNFDFGRACCNHDHCWSSSSHSKTECDFNFFCKC
jgi:hypothetical protein